MNDRELIYSELAAGPDVTVIEAPGPEPMMLYPLVTEEGFPAGVCCMGACDRHLPVGTPYASVLERVDADGTEYRSIQCVYCAAGVAL